MDFKNLKIAFFTEAGTKRGMGHLVRSRSIYEAFEQKGIQALFFLDSDQDYSYKYPDIHYFSWKTFSLKERFDIVFIDSYEASIDIYNQVSEFATIGVYLDDFARLEYPKGVIINFAPDAKQLFYPHPKAIHRYLLGLNYLPLRKAIANTKPPSKKKQLFIMLGGMDVADLSVKIVQLLHSLQIPIVVVANKIQQVSMLQNFFNVKVLFQPKDSELINEMAQSTLAIVTASMSVYELAYLQTPSIILSVAKNQTLGVKQFLNHKLACSFVDINSTGWDNMLKKEVESSLLTNTKTKCAVIDAKGKERIVKQVLSLCKKL